MPNLVNKQEEKLANGFITWFMKDSIKLSFKIKFPLSLRKLIGNPLLYQNSKQEMVVVITGKQIVNSLRGEKPQSWKSKPLLSWVRFCA